MPIAVANIIPSPQAASALARTTESPADSLFPQFLGEAQDRVARPAQKSNSQSAPKDQSPPGDQPVDPRQSDSKASDQTPTESSNASTQQNSHAPAGDTANKSPNENPSPDVSPKVAAKPAVWLQPGLPATGTEPVKPGHLADKNAVAPASPDVPSANPNQAVGPVNPSPPALETAAAASPPTVKTPPLDGQSDPTPGKSGKAASNSGGLPPLPTSGSSNSDESPAGTAPPPVAAPAAPQNKSASASITTAPWDFSPQPAAAHSAATPALSAPATPDSHFVMTNQPTIIQAIHGQLLPGGGSMQIRLDPPELGALQITVRMQNGVMSATFQTSNDQATRLLSHSLSQLKTALETQGVSVARLHVEQAPRSDSSGGHEDSSQQNQSPHRQDQQDEQRRQLMRRLWRQTAFGRDPLDLVA